MFGQMKETIKQAAQMRGMMKKKKKELAAKKFEVESKDGLIKIFISGDMQVKQISLEKKLLEKDPSIVENLLTSAINTALKKVQKETAADMQDLTKNMGGLGSLFNK